MLQHQKHKKERDKGNQKQNCRPRLRTLLPVLALMQKVVSNLARRLHETVDALHGTERFPTVPDHALGA